MLCGCPFRSSRQAARMRDRHVSLSCHACVSELVRVALAPVPCPRSPIRTIKAPVCPCFAVSGHGVCDVRSREQTAFSSQSVEVYLAVPRYELVCFAGNNSECNLSGLCRCTDFVVIPMNFRDVTCVTVSSKSVVKQLASRDSMIISPICHRTRSC